MLAHGGIATLAVVFALAFSGFYVADALAQIAVSVLSQLIGDPEEGFGFQFTIAGTEIYYGGAFQYALALALILGVLYASWRLTRSAVRTCPECRSDIPREASVCRYCTAELPKVP